MRWYGLVDRKALVGGVFYSDPLFLRRAHLERTAGNEAKNYLEGIIKRDVLFVRPAWRGKVKCELALRNALDEGWEARSALRFGCLV